MFSFLCHYHQFFKHLLFNYLLIIIFIMKQLIYAKHTTHNHSTIIHSKGGISIIKWEFHEFSTHITVMLFLMILICLKLAYHYIPYISSYIPESLLLILIGITFGSIVFYKIENYTIDNTVWKFTPSLFSYYLLPPIILQSSYELYNRTFSEYLGVILIFSVIGTICNFLFIGIIMYGIYIIGGFGQPKLNMNIKLFLLFSSLIVAVDPVAVLAIFQDIGVELSLYYIVFGESLFNDAITIVLNNIMIVFNNNEQLSSIQIFIGIASFFTVSFGGLFIGVLFGIITCLITRIHSHLSVFTILLLAYFSYIIADCIGWSGIISMIGCGLIQAAYAFHNIGEKYVKSLHLITKILAEVSEAVIFLFLGIQVISYKLEWHTGFIIWGLILCLLSRTIVIFCITAIVNYVNIDETKITISQQIILIYGGLRGAVAFALAVLIPEDIFPMNGIYHKNIIVTTTLFIILFTVGFMGITIKPLMKLLKIPEQMMTMNMNKKQYRKISMNTNDILFDQLSHNNQFSIYASNSKRKGQLDLNEAFNDLLKYHQPKQSMQLEEFKQTEQLNIEHDENKDTIQSKEDTDEKDSHIEQYNQHSTHSLQPDIRDYRKRRDLRKDIE
ncbi:putative sodium/hydrogen exchanger [Schistosoma mansoni]|uniref:putative sodium/hydrogen exchanger n=1 Tax=Schistosoma mansoni TaxID=6183 RepID=UPI00022DC849|nr:putative sodium/hydrogen exchanger [Schistosoma mansoni]|eukprot:XP_018652696.1 putative sodium/hydrogen exchanger [Schistosoma mansoni]